MRVSNTIPRTLLLAPKLPYFYNSKNQLLQIEEEVPLFNDLVWLCFSCFDAGSRVNSLCRCSESQNRRLLPLINPKYLYAMTMSGGAFLKGPATFIVTNELVVKPFSLISGISFINKFSFPISDLEEVVVSVGEMEALSLLRTSLISNTVLSDVFCSKKPQQSRKRSSEGSVPSVKRAKTETECL